MALIARADRFRYPITAIAVVGLGALVALAVGVSLYLGLSSAAENTRRLIAQRSGTLVSDLDRRITSQLQTVVQRSRWAVEQIESGDVTMEDSQALNTFMRFILGTTPHLAEIAITDPRALSRRWTGTSAQPTVEQWSDRPEITAWLDARASEIGPRWRAPSWSATLGATVLHLDMPIRIDGTFAGVLSQAVTISDLSQHIALVGAEDGVIPFILYGRDHVLAHPLLISRVPHVTDRDHALVDLGALGDAVLERIRAPGNRELPLLRGMTEVRSTRVAVGEDLYVLFYRDIDRFGPQPWTIGAHVRFGTSDLGKWLAGIVRTAVSGRSRVPEPSTATSSSAWSPRYWRGSPCSSSPSRSRRGSAPARAVWWRYWNATAGSSPSFRAMRSSRRSTCRCRTRTMPPMHCGRRARCSAQRRGGPSREFASPIASESTPARVVAGAVGAKGRLSYTVHGDAVNLAARLEALNKELGTRILVSEATVAQVAGFELRPVREVRIRGQSGRVAVYALGGTTD